MVRGMPALTTYLPDMRRYLLGFPDAQVPDVTSFLYWQETEFGLKPTIRINHLTIHEGADETVVASKMLYASHYFWTALELRVLRPDPSRGQGFWLVTINRSRSDGLSGLTGIFVRRRVRSEAVRGVMAGTRGDEAQTGTDPVSLPGIASITTDHPDSESQAPPIAAVEAAPAPQTIPGGAPTQRPTARSVRTTPHAGAHVPRPIPPGTASTRAAGWIRGRPVSAFLVLACNTITSTGSPCCSTVRIGTPARSARSRKLASSSKRWR